MKLLTYFQDPKAIAPLAVSLPEQQRFFGDQMMELKVFIVDAFTDRPFSGNPAAVVPLMKNIDDTTMQKIASEMNHSGTTFTYPLPNGPNNCSLDDWKKASRFSLRWFTSTQEMDICGHATLATAQALFECLDNKNNEIEFETKCGVLLVKQEANLLVLHLPAHPPVSVRDTNQDIFRRIVNACTGHLRDKVSEILYNPIIKYILVRLDDSTTKKNLINMSPNFTKMAAIHDGTLVKGVGVTLAGDAPEGVVPFKYHAYSRFFGLWIGINEDPVCGSWHSVMGPYWGAKLGVKNLMFHQCSKRGGDIRMTLLEDGKVSLAGPCVTVLKGSISI